MKFPFQITYYVTFDIDDAYNDYLTCLDWYPKEYDRAIDFAVKENICCPNDVDIPDATMEEIYNTLRKRIGGIQLEMDLD